MSFARPTAQRRPAKIKDQAARDGWEVSMQELPTVQASAPTLPGSSGGLTAGRDRGALSRGEGAGEAARRGHPRPQLRAPRAPGRRRLRRRFARPLPRRRRHRRLGDRLLRRPLHGRDRLGALAREDRADPRPRRRLLAGRLDHRRAARRLEGRAPGSDGRDVRQHVGRGQGRDRLLLHLLQRRRRRRAHLAGARSRDRDPVRPGHVAGGVRRARDRPDRRSRATGPLPRLGRRVSRPRRHPARRHHRDARRASRMPSS